MSAIAGFKNMTTLGKVHDRVLDMAKDHHDEFVPVGDITFDCLESVSIAGEKHVMRTTAQREISNRLGVPYSYLRKCPEDVQAYNLNHWIEKEKNDELFFRFDDDEVRAVFTPRYVPMDNVAVMDRLDNLGFKHDAKVQCQMERDAVEWGWIFEAGNTMFSVVNAYTKAAQYEDLTA